MNKLVIIGAGGHGKVIADNAIKNGYENICFIDDEANGDVIGFPVVGSLSALSELQDDHTEFIIGIGDNAIRKTIAESYDLKWATLIHPSAQIAKNTHIAQGTVVMACAVVNTCATIGKHCIINTGAIIEHDNVINDYAHISPRATLGGTVTIGTETQIGTGAVVSNNRSVCANCLIGAGAVVVKNITEKGTYVGVPARLLR